MAHNNREPQSGHDEVFICRCGEVTESEVLAAIADGASTVKGVKIRTDAGMGLCQGRTCRRLISRMLARTQPRQDIYPPTVRPPVRTAKIREYTEEE